MKTASVLLAATMLVLPACQSSRNDAAPLTTGPSDAVPLSLVEQSQLREDALAVLDEMMTSAWAQDRANAIEAISHAGSRAQPWVALGLKDANEGVRAVAAQVVARASLCELAPSVRPLRNDPSAFVRASALYALATCDETTDLTPIAGMLLGDPSPRVRAHAAYLIGELGNDSAIPMLRQAAAADLPLASDGEIRLMQLQVAEAMVKLGDQDAIQGIRAALHPARPEELEATALAVQIIGEVGDKRSIDQLVYLSAFVDEQGNPLPGEIRLAIASAMAKLGHPEGAFIADEYAASARPALRAQAAQAYGATAGSRGLRALETLLADPDPGVRLAAAAGVLDAMASNTLNAAAVGE